jgi:hypothetical protein
MKLLFPALLAVSLPAAAAYDMNGVKLGASEREVKKFFPLAYCKPLEWQSTAADRRCDDAKAIIGGVEGRITFYLRNDAVQAFDLRFDSKDLDRLLPGLKSRYGKPASETRDHAKGGKEIYKALWEDGKDRAMLVSQADKKRSQLTVARGNFEEELYKVR